jgi:hypothetical protein
MVTLHRHAPRAIGRSTGDRCPGASPADRGLALARTGTNSCSRGVHGGLIGYRWHDARNIDPLFPFGYGLSYTTFRYDGAELTSSPGAADGWHVGFTVTNTGPRDGTEVAQVYVGACSGDVKAAPKQLAGFTKVPLRRGESKRVSIDIDPRSMSSWSMTTHSWQPVSCAPTVYVGSSSRDVRLTVGGAGSSAGASPGGGSSAGGSRGGCAQGGGGGVGTPLALWLLLVLSRSRNCPMSSCRRWSPRGSSRRSTDATMKLMLRGLCSSALVTVVLACGGGQPQQPNEQPPAASAPPTQNSGSPPSLNPIVRENARSGDTAWQLTHRAPPGVLEGYAGAPSVDHGEALDVHVRADGPHKVRWQAWRMGWYGGAQGRLVASGGPVPVAQQPAPVPTPTGLIACNWPMTFVVQTDPTWTSGIYMVKLFRNDGFDAYVPFVVRADERKGVGVYEVPFTTYQAYNSWGGLSLYDGSPPAVEVSFDRPFVEGNGSGQYFWFEHFFVTWAESRGYDLTYLTNIDVDRDPTLLTGQKLFLVVGHDEYWSRPEREAVESALGDGTSIAAFSANTGYWQVRRAPTAARGGPSSAGSFAPTRRTHCAGPPSRPRAGAARLSASPRVRCSASSTAIGSSARGER